MRRLDRPPVDLAPSSFELLHINDHSSGSSLISQKAFKHFQKQKKIASLPYKKSLQIEGPHAGRVGRGRGSISGCFLPRVPDHRANQIENCRVHDIRENMNTSC